MSAADQVTPRSTRRGWWSKRRKLWLALIVLLGAGVLSIVALRVRLKRHGLGSLAAVGTESSLRKAGRLETAVLIYDGQLLAGWDDWGWGPHELGNGPAKVVFQGYGGILFHGA